MYRACTNHPDNFYYVCGLLCIKYQRRTITNQLKDIYKLYFGCPLGDQDKSWAPHVILVINSASGGIDDIKICVNLSDLTPNTYQQLKISHQLPSKRSYSQFEIFIGKMKSC